MARNQTDLKAIIDRILTENNIKGYRYSRNRENCVVVVVPNINRIQTSQILKQISTQGYEIKRLSYHPHGNTKVARRMGNCKVLAPKGHIVYQRGYSHITNSKRPPVVSGTARIVVAPPQKPGPTRPLPDPDGAENGGHITVFFD